MLLANLKPTINPISHFLLGLVCIGLALMIFGGVLWVLLKILDLTSDNNDS